MADYTGYTGDNVDDPYGGSNSALLDQSTYSSGATPNNSNQALTDDQYQAMKATNATLPAADAKYSFEQFMPYLTSSQQKDYLSPAAISFSDMLSSSKGTEMMLAGIGASAKAVLDWQSARYGEEAKTKQIDQMAQHNSALSAQQYQQQQDAIEADIKRRSSRAKIGRSTK